MTSINELRNIMFLDIETVPMQKSFSEMPEALAHLWEEKYNILQKRMPEKYTEDTSAAQGFEKSAGIYAEFGKIVCISVGFIYLKNNELCFRVKSFANDDEKKLLSDFCELVEKFRTSASHTFCGHNIKEFDIPYICRRIIINQLELPPVFQIAGKKPWENPFIDTLELWKFGDYKNYTSLKLLTEVLGVPTPKDDIDGSQVADVYYIENNLERIARYCEKDVLATAQVFLRLNGRELISTENVEFT